MSLTQEQKMQDYGEFLKALRLVPQLRVAFTMNNYQKARERASFAFNLAPDSLYSVGVFSAVIAELHNHMEHGDLPEIVDPHEFDILTPEFVRNATAAQIRALTQRQLDKLVEIKEAARTAALAAQRKVVAEVDYTAELEAEFQKNVAAVGGITVAEVKQRLAEFKKKFGGKPPEDRDPTGRLDPWSTKSLQGRWRLEKEEAFKKIEPLLRLKADESRAIITNGRHDYAKTEKYRQAAKLFNASKGF